MRAKLVSHQLEDGTLSTIGAKAEELVDRFREWLA